MQTKPTEMNILQVSPHSQSTHRHNTALYLENNSYVDLCGKQCL